MNLLVQETFWALFPKILLSHLSKKLNFVPILLDLTALLCVHDTLNRCILHQRPRETTYAAFQMPSSNVVHNRNDDENCVIQFQNLAVLNMLVNHLPNILLHQSHKSILCFHAKEHRQCIFRQLLEIN